MARPARSIPHAAAAATRKTSAALSFRTVLLDQRLKTRIVSQWVPNRIYFQTLDRDSAWSAQQPVQNFNRLTAVAKNGVNLDHFLLLARKIDLMGRFPASSCACARMEWSMPR